MILRGCELCGLKWEGDFNSGFQKPKLGMRWMRVAGPQSQLVRILKRLPNAPRYVNSSLRDERLPKGPRFASESLDADTGSGSFLSKMPPLPGPAAAWSLAAREARIL